ncbi:trypsin-like peptidase domain-containing protein [Metasolibacillus meyeri]|uniref:trypsin-like peptidase domain-containing protein n=1 Tax=Metasolibacillus meyeri TaxID=1071052 RepID=UPI000D30F69A|nr:trypsin-like peptidase domain-containing protein [Metasolibacillus meyeri]
MFVTTRPLKIKYKSLQNPMQDFIQNHDSHRSLTKEVVFLRYIGIAESVELYKNDILKMEEYFAQQSIPYLRLHKLEGLTNKAEIDRMMKRWEEWQIAMEHLPLLDKTPLGNKLNNASLEWTKKLSFKQMIQMLKDSQPHASPTLIKNFAVKFLYWMDCYLPRLFSEEHRHSPKVVFIGDVTQHELYFLYFLSMLGCDICYMNPKEDVVNLHPIIAAASTLYKCQNVYQQELTMPALSVQSPQPTVVPVQTAKVIPTPTKECSYEQLASLAVSVVMIKTFGPDREVVCFGSGVVLHRDGYILTNLHVVSGGEYFSVLYENDATEYTTDQFVKYHHIYDLAILKVNRAGKALPVKMDGQLVRGQKIVAIGSPLGLFNSVSDGIVSGFRDIRQMPMIQFTAPISNGSSGGALLNMHGQLVGLITAGFDDGQNLNLAVPAHVIYQFAQNFIEVSGS